MFLVQLVGSYCILPNAHFNMRLYFQKQAPHDFSLDLFLLYQAKKYGYGIKEIPVYFKKRLHGEAKGGGSWQTRSLLIKRTLRYIIKFKSLS